MIFVIMFGFVINLEKLFFNFSNLRADKALQDIVYKVVPGLYRTEMQNRVKFYTRHPDAEPANSEDAGEVADSLFFSPEDDISMSIEYFDNIR